MFNVRSKENKNWKEGFYMFDPTAFENMRVVMEGIFYDKDLSGDITIVDRNDVINTAKMSRDFDLSFQLKSTSVSKVTCKVTLKANIENLAAELLTTSRSAGSAGCIVTIEFLFENDRDESVTLEVDQLIRKIWGEDRIVKQMIRYEPLNRIQRAHHTVLISFDRIIREDQMDDLIEMHEYMLITLDKLECVVKE
jgi:hypothetical protein